MVRTRLRIIAPVALSFLHGERVGEARPFFEFSASAVNLSDQVGPGSESKPSKVAVIPIVGTITKYDSCFTIGAVTYARAIKRAADDPEICAIVLDIDSGGGAANAVSILKEAIAKRRHSASRSSHM